MLRLRPSQPAPLCARSGFPCSPPPCWLQTAGPLGIPGVLGCPPWRLLFSLPDSHSLCARLALLCAGILCFPFFPAVCTTEPSSRGRCSTRRLKDFERLPGIGPTERSALVTQHMPNPVMHQDRPQGFSFIVLVHLDCGARLPGMKPQPCLLLVASGLFPRLSEPASLRLGNGMWVARDSPNVTMAQARLPASAPPPLCAAGGPGHCLHHMLTRVQFTGPKYTHCCVTVPTI